jgi:chemotaxis protein CheX
MNRDDLLRERLTEKARELFSAYGVTCTEVTERTDEDQLCAVLGFTGDTLRGSVVVVATAAALTASNPIAGGSPSAWVSELTNQLVGRFKNDLLRYGVDVMMSIPVVLTAKRIVAVSGHEIRPIQLGVGAGTLTMWLEAEGDAQLAEIPMPDQQVAAEGDLMLF